MTIFIHALSSGATRGRSYAKHRGEAEYQDSLSLLLCSSCKIHLRVTHTLIDRDRLNEALDEAI